MNPESFRAVSGFVRAELLKDGAYLLPLRLFIGLGWTRAFAEKVFEPGWRDGSSVSAFLEEQLAGGHVVFPFYRALVTDVFLPNAAVLGWGVMLGELLAGVAILVGMFSNAALLGGLFMNLNFVLAGVPNPSAFYIIIQLTLFTGGVGAIVGVDAFLGRHLKTPLIVAQNASAREFFRPKKRAFPTVALVFLGIAAYSCAHVATFDPGLSIEDPAMILAVLFTMGSVAAFISYLRQRPPDPVSAIPRFATASTDAEDPTKPTH